MGKPKPKQPAQTEYLSACLDTLKVCGTYWGQQFKPRPLWILNDAENECPHGACPTDTKFPQACNCWKK